MIVANTCKPTAGVPPPGAASKGTTWSRPVQPTDEASLVAALRAGDERAFETVVRTYGGRLLSVARRFMRNDEDAQDVVQSAYLSAFRALETFEGTAQLSTWLHRIVVNTALMKLRARRRRPEESIEDLLPRIP